MGTHFRRECEHGFTISQCRCPDPSKAVTIVPCPTPLRHEQMLAASVAAAEPAQEGPVSRPDPEVGEWVFVYAKVLENRSGVGVLVELFSKTDQYDAWVRPDLIYTAPQDETDICTALFAAPDSTLLLLRCMRGSGHPPLHRTAEGDDFTDAQVVGWIEEK